MKNYKLFMLALTITNCSTFAPIKQADVQKYIITYSQDANSQCISSKTNKSIYIRTMGANVPYNTNSMFYSRSSYTINQYSYSVWSSPPQNSIGQAINQSIENSCLFSNIYTDLTNVNVTADYQLLNNLEELKQNIQEQNTQTILVVQVVLINNSTHKITTKLFTETTKKSPSPQNMVIGVNEDLKKFTTHLVSWLGVQINSH